MKQFFLHILCLTALCLVLSNCKHEQPTEPAAACQYDSSVEEMKKWYYFKIGTWWIYQEETTGALDTVTVYHNWDGINTGGFEGFEWTATSTFDNYDQFYWFNTSYSIHCLSRKECNCHKLSRGRGQAGDYVGEGWLFLYPIIEGNFSYLISSNGSFGGQTTLNTLTDSIQHNGITYYNVAAWHVYPDGSEGDIASDYLIARNVGVIRHEVPSQNKIWNLISYQIQQ